SLAFSSGLTGGGASGCGVAAVAEISAGPVSACGIGAVTTLSLSAEAAEICDSGAQKPTAISATAMAAGPAWRRTGKRKRASMGSLTCERDRGDWSTSAFQTLRCRKAVPKQNQVDRCAGTGQRDQP